MFSFDLRSNEIIRYSNMEVSDKLGKISLSAVTNANVTLGWIWVISLKGPREIIDAIAFQEFPELKRSVEERWSRQRM